MCSKFRKKEVKVNFLENIAYGMARTLDVGGTIGKKPVIRSEVADVRDAWKDTGIYLNQAISETDAKMRERKNKIGFLRTKE